MEKETKMEYKNNDLTIVWKPKTCIHSAVCVKMLPNVYKPKERPWLTIENASTEELIAQIKKCPSGALSYYMNDEEKQEEIVANTNVDVLEKGPLLIHGTLLVTHENGQTETKNNATAFCRCGHSNNKPYCDGSHRKNA